ncbi:esterase/lipase family protein [Halopiger goleimassiliensis]|uniref:esterase/lipase family protein n=1 Tax=Halopiger goleimassiliensis TaxID=1293048 RepID=UPI000677DD37|nr:alpha/beta hydrolase [Halopiger goleimassiliensis]
MADNHDPETERTDDSRSTTRRTMLKATGTTAVAATGLTAVTGSASAQWFGDVDVIEVEEGLFGWSADDDLPVADELYVFIHGWFGDTTVQSQAEDVLDSLEAGGYEPDEAVALEWPATTFNFPGAESDTEDVGEVTAELAEDFYDSGGGNIRLVGHSLGGRCVLWAADKIGSSYEIDTIAPLGAAADGDMVCDGLFGSGEWYDGIVEGAGVVRNYHSNNDSTVGSAYGGIGGAALGNDGSGCPGDTPDNYVDVDVTDSVSSHLGFLGDDVVGENLAQNLDSTEEGDTGGGIF